MNSLTPQDRECRQSVRRREKAEKEKGHRRLFLLKESMQLTGRACLFNPMHQQLYAVVNIQCSITGRLILTAQLTFILHKVSPASNFPFISPLGHQPTGVAPTGLLAQILVGNDSFPRTFSETTAAVVVLRPTPTVASVTHFRVFTFGRHRNKGLRK